MRLKNDDRSLAARAVLGRRKRCHNLCRMMAIIVNFIGSIETATRKVINSLNPGDLVITLGAGSITGLSDEILVALKEKEAAAQ